MRFERCADAAEAATRAAHAIAEAVRADPAIVLGLATGRTTVPVYAALARLHRDGLALRRVRSFNLDEYVGLAADDPRSFAFFMRHHLVAATDIDPAAVHLPDGMEADPAAEAARYERAIAATGGIGLQLLGIGGNGHVGFNEPGTPADARTHVATLSAATRAQNAAAFGSAALVPARAITMGLGTIRAARRVVLLATGAAKAEAVGRAFASTPTADLPASALQRHPDCLVILDRDAARALGPGPTPTDASERGSGTARHGG